MLSENIRKLRKEKGISQEELAAKLNVVRQTVSKWEQTLSVPDSEMLIKIAEIFEVSVGTLLGETVEIKDTKTELEEISQKLENLNAMMAERNSRSRRIWLTAVAVCLLLIASIMIAYIVLSTIQMFAFVTPFASVGVIGGADGPTQILVSPAPDWYGIIITSVLTAIVIGISIVLIRKAKK